jgi:hypothetical protein
VNPFSGIDTNPNPVFSSSSSPIFNDPIFTTPRRITISTPPEPAPKVEEKKPEEKKPEEEKKPDEKKPENQEPAKQPEATPNNNPAGSTPLPPVAAGQQANLPPQQPGAANLQNTTPAASNPPAKTPEQIEAERKQAEELKASITFNEAGTTAFAQTSSTLKIMGQAAEKLAPSLQAALAEELAQRVAADPTLADPENRAKKERELQDEILQKIWSEKVVQPEMTVTVLPTPYDFSQVKQPARIQVLLGLDNMPVLPPKSVLSSGYSYLDGFAETEVRKVLEADAKKTPPTNTYRLVEIPIKFNIPPKLPTS